MWQQLVKLITSFFGNQQPETTPETTPAPVLSTWEQKWERERAERRAAREELRRQRKAADRRHFGDETWGVSAKQRTAINDATKLTRFDLPMLSSEAEFAAWLGISRSRLRWFSYDRPAERISHYVYRFIPKRSGGQRLIMAPKRDLKAIQHHILRGILEKVPVSPEAHGFVKGRSIVSNAAPHTQQSVIINIDLKDFFPGITYPRVRGLFISLGYSYAVAATLALVCTESEREAFEHRGQNYYISVGTRCLPQGAPTSPALANMAAWRLDRRLAGLARSLGWQYTRYADDLTFSGENADEIGRVLAAAKKIIADEQFVVHPDKIRVTHQARRQTVTGLVVNDGIGTPRELRRRVRAILHQARTTGLAAQNRDEHPDFYGYLTGLIGHIAAANPQQAAALRSELRELVR
jgi:retron-type reverse transcriptase